VARGEAGAIFALEVSRLARSSQDGQRLLALCAVAEVVVLDEQAIYDPRNGDDKLLLDFKGTMSEAELHWLSLRLRGAQNTLAKRGELRFNPPTGFVWGAHGFEKDPDLAVQNAIGMLFERFDIEPSIGRVVRWARQSGFRIPTRRAYADGTDELRWNELYRTRLKEILKNPLYAGAYAYGRRRETKVLVEGEIHTARRHRKSACCSCRTAAAAVGNRRCRAPGARSPAPSRSPPVPGRPRRPVFESHGRLSQAWRPSAIRRRNPERVAGDAREAGKDARSASWSVTNASGSVGGIGRLDSVGTGFFLRASARSILRGCTWR
jgi:DNA invertase Pin-like site-specific DNA recombinase